MTSKDLYLSFLLEDLDIRGAIVQLRGAWHSLQAGRDYTTPVARLLGELAAVSVLLGANLKQDGRITFQLRGAGPVNLLVMDCDNQLRLRGMARADANVADLPVPDLLGHGQLALTLDIAGLDTPYQSLVPLSGTTLSDIFEHFLAQSEQQPTRLFLMANENTAAGLLVQKLPSADEKDADGWNRIQSLSETVRSEELAQLMPTDLLSRLYADEVVRIFEPRGVTHHCPKDFDKVKDMLLAVGQAECETVVQEHGSVTVQDEICNHEYVFDAAAIAALFGPKTLH